MTNSKSTTRKKKCKKNELLADFDNGLVKRCLHQLHPLWHLQIRIINLLIHFQLTNIHFEERRYAIPCCYACYGPFNPINPASRLDPRAHLFAENSQGNIQSYTSVRGAIHQRHILYCVCICSHVHLSAQRSICFSPCLGVFRVLELNGKHIHGPTGSTQAVHVTPNMLCVKGDEPGFFPREGEKDTWDATRGTELVRGGRACVCARLSYQYWRTCRR